MALKLVLERSKRFGRNFVFSVNMSARDRRTVLDIPQIALGPELAADFIGLAAVLQKLAGKSPMAVILEPGGQTILMTLLAQARHIVVSDPVGHQTAHIPQETVRCFGRFHHITVISRQVRQRIIAVPLPERFEEIIGKILAAGFVTILDHHLECLAVLSQGYARESVR